MASKLSTKFSNKFLIILTTLAIIALGFIYYFLSYVPTNKKLIDQRGFRVLNRTEINLNALKDNFIKNTYNRQYEQLLTKSLPNNDSTSSAIEFDIEAFQNIALNQALKPIRIEQHRKASKSKFQYNVGNNTLEISGHYDRIPIEENINLVPEIIFELAPKDFFSGALQFGYFDQYILILNNQVAYSTFNTGKQFNTDTLETTALTGEIIDFTIDKNKFKGYLKSFDLNPKVNCTVVGLKEESGYKTAIYSVENLLVIYISLALLITVISLPLLKLFFMNKYERLYLSNVYFAGVSVILLASFFFIFFYTAYYYFSDRKKNIDPQLLALTKKVESTFIHKIKQSHALLSLMDKEQTDESFLFAGDNNKISKVYSDPSILGIIYPEFINPKSQLHEDFNSLFWVDKEGIVKKLITANNITSDSNFIDLSQRTYFSDVLHKKTYFLPGNDSARFSFQSIRSWADGVNEIGIGIQSKQTDYAVVALSSRFSGLMDIALPPDYSFCIIDKKGEVLLHSNNKKNLVENFIEETNNNSELISAIKGRVNEQIYLKYTNQNYRISISPVNNIPFYVVAMKDMKTYRSAAAIKVIIAFTLCSVLYVLMILILLANTFYSFKFSKLKVKKFRLSWLKPKQKNTIKYLILLLTLVVLILTALILCSVSGENYIIFYLTYFNLLGTYICVILLNSKSGNYVISFCTFAFPMLSVWVLNISFPTGLTFTSITLIAFVFYFKLCSHFTVSEKELLNQEDAPTNSTLAQKTKFWLAKKVNVIGTNISTRYLQYYHRYIFTWVVLVSILPCIYFIQLSNNIVNKVWIKYKLIHLKEQSDQIKQRIDHDFSKIADKTGFIDRKKDSVFTFINTFSIEKQKSLVANGYTVENVKNFRNNKNIKNIVSYLHFNLNPVIKDARSYIHNFTDNNEWKWQYYDTDSSSYYLLSTFEENHGVKNKVYYATIKPSISQGIKSYGIYEILLFTFIIALTVALYRTIIYCTKRLFATDFRSFKASTAIDVDTISTLSGKNLMVVGLPYSGKKKLIGELTQMLDKNNTPYQKLDMMSYIHDDNKSLEINPNSRFFIVKNFEYDKNNYSSTLKKLNFLEAILSYKEHHLNQGINFLLFSQVHPGFLIEHFNKNIKTEGNEQNPKSEETSEKWHRLLGSFTKTYLPLKKGFLPENEALIQIHPHAKLIKSELLYAKLNPSEVTILLDKIEGLPNNEHIEENIVLTIQSYLQPYYRAIWNTFSYEEKFLVYDLAQNKFANVKNERILQVLLEKGLFVYKDGIKLFNKSFNNFVLSIIKEEEKEEMNRRLIKKGSWNVIYVIILILVLSIGIFLSFSQKELLNNINAAISSIIAFIGLLLRYTGFFAGGGKK